MLGSNIKQRYLCRIHFLPALTIAFLLFALELSAQSSQQQAFQYYRQGNYKEALTAFEQLISTGSAAKEIYLGAIDCAVKLNNNNKAIQIIESAERKYGIQYDWTYILAQLYAQGGKLTSAIGILQKLKKAYPDSSSIRITLSEAYSSIGAKQYKENKFDDAYNSFKEALKNNPESSELKRNLLAVCLRLQRFEEALPLAKALFSPTKPDREIAQLYFQLLLQTNKYKEALKVSQALIKVYPDNIEYLLNEALAYRYDSNYDSATSKYAQLRKRFPKSKEVYKAEIDWLMASGLKDSVIVRCREFLLSTPDDDYMMLTMAQQYQRKKSYDTARTIYREMRAKDFNRDAAIPIADCYISEGKTDSAIIELDNYTVTGGKNPDAFITLYSLLFKANRTDDVKRVLRTGIAKLEGEGIFSVLLAKQYMFESKIDTAFIYLEPVRVLFTQFPEISYITARLYELKTDTAKAVFHYIRFLKHSMKQSQLLQTQISTSISGDGMMDPDSLNKAQKAGTALDTLTAQLRNGFERLKQLTAGPDYLNIINELIADVPQGTPLYIARAHYYQGKYDVEAAQKDIETALRIAPYNEETQREAGNFYYSIGKLELAFNAYRAALNKNNKVNLYYERMIEISLKLNRTDEVIEYWKRWYEADQENKTLKSFLIEILHKTDRLEEASKISKEE